MTTFIALVQALPDFFKALPYLAQLGLRVMDITVKLASWAKENNIEEYILDAEKTTDQLQKAKTPKEKLDAGKSYIDLIGRLG